MGWDNCPYGATVCAAALLTNLALRLLPIQQSGEELESRYLLELICRIEDEAHMRALMLHAMANKSLMLTSLSSEDLEGSPKLKVSALIKGAGRKEQELEDRVARLSLEPGVTSFSWSTRTSVLE